MDKLSSRTWLDVPYSEKDAAKAAGARWDPRERRWYAPSPKIEALSRWVALPDIPDLLPGEDRTVGSGLFVDLVPSSCWFTNVRSCADGRDWERLRHMVVLRAGGKCEACGHAPDRERQQWAEAHERWEYNDETHVQALRRLVCLCTICHRTTHFGLAELQGQREDALANLMAVNQWTGAVAERHVQQAFEIWRARCDIDWTLDLSILTDAGLRMAPLPSTASRRGRSAKQLESRRALLGETA